MPNFQRGPNYDPNRNTGHIGRMRDQMQERVDTYNTWREENYNPRFDWSEGDWQRAMQGATQPQSRQRRDGTWEYLVQGSWVPQAQFDDPMWQRNVYQPWMQKVQNHWRVLYEDTMKKKGTYERSNPFQAIQPPGMGGGGSQGAGRVGSRTYRGGGGGGGGGGGQMSPEIMQYLLGG